MKSIKRILFAALVFLGAAFLVITSLYFLVDDATLFAGVVKQLESASDIRVLQRGNVHITRTLTPTLTVDGLIVADTDKQYRVKTGSLQVQVSLPRLLLGELDIPKLSLGNTQIQIKKDESPAKAPAPPEVKSGSSYHALPLKPILHDVQISRLEIMHKGGSLLLPHGRLREITLELNPDNTLKTSGQMELAHHNIEVNAVLKDVDDYSSGQPLTFSIEAHGKLLHLSLQGDIDFEQAEPTIKAALRGWTPSAAKIVTSIQGFEIPGKLTLEAQLQGTSSLLPMEEITATWHGPHQSMLQLKGSVANVIKFEGVQLNLSGKLESPSWLTPLLPESVGAVRSAGVKAQISGGYPTLAVNNFDFQGKTEQDFDLSLSGRFDLSLSSTGLEPINMQTELVFAAPTTRAARVLLFEAIPELGAIAGRCDVRSTEGDPSLEKIAVHITDKGGIEAKLSGTIAAFPLADRPNKGYELDVSMQATEAAVMAERLGLKLPELGSLDLDFRIEGSTPALQLNQIKLSAGKKDEVRLAAQGQITFGDWDQADPLQTVDLKLQAQTLTTRPLSTLLGQQLPELGPLSGEAHLHTVAGRHRLDQLHIQTVETDPLSFVVSGSAGQVTLLPELRIQEIKLDAKAGSDDTGKLNEVFGLQDEIPPIGPLQAQVRIEGDDRNLVITDTSLQAGQKDLLLVNMSGRLGELRPANQWRPQNTSLSIQAVSSSSRALAGKLGYRLPELGPLSAQAEIHSKTENLSIEAAKLRLGEIDKPVMKAVGSINDLQAMKGVKLDAQLHLDGHRLAAFAESDKLPDLAAVTGQLSISDTDGSLGLDSLHVETEQSKLLSLKLDGRFDNFKDPSTLLLNGSLTARDLKLIGAIFDRQWAPIGPVQLDSEITNSGRGKEFDITLTAGETEVESKLSILFDTTPMLISGTFKAKNMLVYDLFEKQSKEDKKKPAKNEPVFSHEPIDFGWLKKVDVDVAIEVESFAQEKFLAKSGEFHIKVKSGQLSINPARLVYPKGKIDMDLELDARDHPRLTFKAFGENIDPRRALDMLEGNNEIDAEMNIDLSLSTSGLTPHELAANSQGNIYITLKHGKLPAPLIDLVFWDVAGWAWRKATDQRYYDIDCGVADYSIDKGIVSTEAFILDAQHITISGGGTIDLGGEKVKYFFVPKKKSLKFIQKADPVNIEGPLNHPEVSTVPWKSAAITAGKVGGIIFAPFIFIPLTAADYLAGKAGNKNGESACLEYQQTHKIENRLQEKWDNSK